MYDISNQSWNEDTFSFAYSGMRSLLVNWERFKNDILSSVGGNLTAVYGADGFGDVFIWEETALYYSPNGGQYRLAIQWWVVRWCLWVCCVLFVCITGETVNSLEVYVHSEATESMEVFEWSNEDYIKQTVSGQIHRVTEQSCFQSSI